MQIDGFSRRNDWIAKCKKEIINKENINPFPKPPIATNFYNNPPLFCFGRDNLIEEIKEEIRGSIHFAEPKLIRTIGKQGIGKSTLVCYSVNMLSNEVTLPIVYLETSGQPEDFKMKSLYRQIISKLERINFLDILLIKSISMIVKLFKNQGERLEEQLLNKFSGEDVTQIISNPDYVKHKIQDIRFNQKLFNLITNNGAILNRLIPVDLNFLLTFWKSYVQNPDYMECLNAFRGNDSYSGFSINTDNDASQYIDELIEIFRWAFNNETSFVLIFDHLEAGGSELKENVFSNLFSLLLNLRHKKYLTIFLSGTLDAYNDFDDVLQSDQREQLDNWSKTIALTNLDPENVILIVTKYLLNFWSEFNFSPPSDKILFPFGEKSIKYLYENNGQDLRKTLKNLYDLIEKYRRTGILKEVNSYFAAFRAFRTRDDLTLSYIEQKEFCLKILDPNIQDKHRSTVVEKALCKLFEILSNHPDYNYLTDVRHEPPLGASRKKPDVFLEFFGNKGSSYIKKVGIEVKMYRRTTEVQKGDIKKTFKLLEENAVDYVIWITNAKLNIRHRYDLPSNLYPHLGRISKLNELELAYISLAVYYKEIFNTDPPIQDVEFILNKINLTPLIIKNKLENLPKLTDISISDSKIAITNFIDPQSQTTEKKIIITEIIPNSQRSSIEIGLEQVKVNVQNYINDKSRTNKQITCAATLKAIKKNLNLAENDNTWNDDIWTTAIDLSRGICVRTTLKTIYFRN